MATFHTASDARLAVKAYNDIAGARTTVSVRRSDMLRLLGEDAPQPSRRSATMHTWVVIAFILSLASVVAASIDRQWALALLASAFACWLLPTALQLR